MAYRKKSRAQLLITTVFATLLSVMLLAAIGAPRAFADPPVVTVDSPIDGDTYADSSSAPLLEFSSSGDVSTIDCKYDDTAYRQCNNLMYPGLRLTNGTHTYTLRTVDTSSNVFTTVVHFTIADASPPNISAAVAPNGEGDVEDPVTSPLGLDVTTDDSHSRLYASIDAGGNERLNFSGPSYRWSPEPISNGTHTASFIAIDGAGQVGTASVVFTLDDHTAPDIQVVSPTPSETLVTNELHAEFETADFTGHFNCRIDSQALQRCQPFATALFNDLSVGAHELTIYSEDSVGNSASSITQFTVTDNPVAGMSITEPMDGATYTAQPLLQLNLTNPVEPYTTRCSVNGGKFYFCEQGGFIEGIDHNGAWTVKVRAIDENGDQVSDTASFTINDTTGPQIVATPPAGPINDASGFFPDVTLSDEYADLSPSYYMNARCRLDGGTELNCFQYFFLGAQPEFLPGDHTLAVSGYDWVGNSTTATIPFTVVDTTAPDVQIVSPQNNFVATGGSFTVDYLTSGDAIKVTCQVGSGVHGSCEHGVNDGLESWSPLGLNAGVNTLTVYATDAAGNTGSASVSVTITDSSGPAISFISPALAATVTDNAVARILSGEQLFKLRCAVDSAPLAVDADACWISISDPLTATFRPTSLTAGTHTLWVEGSDAFGNATTISRAINVQDVTAPDLTIEGFNIDEPDPINDSPNSLSYWSSDHSAHFTCSVDGGATTACGASGTGMIYLAQTTDGSHSVTVNAIDPSGNTTPRTINYDVTDTTAPYLWIDDAYDGMPVGTSVTTHPDALGAVTVECAIDAAAFAPCSAAGWTAVFSTNGSHLLRYRATDAQGNSALRTVSVVASSIPPVVPTPDPPADPGTSPPPAPPAPPALPAAKASFSAIKPKVAKSTVTIPLTVNVSLPGGVAAASACSGKATVSVTVDRKIVKSASAPLKLIKGKCQVVASLKIKTKLIAGKKFTAEVAFAGNSAIAKFYSAKAGKSGRFKK